MPDFDQMLKDAILSHYMRQNGGGEMQYPVFRGSPIQYGNGIGDIFKSIGRFLLPIFSSTAKSFVQSTAKGMQEGQSLKDAAKQAIKPTVQSTLQDTTDRLFTKFVGSGRRIYKPRKKKTSKSKKLVKKRARVYKAKSKRKVNHKFKVLNF